jgi:tetratricopeptide (TPR) repeat protein
MQTGMGLSFDVASQKKSSAIFNKDALIYDSSKNFYYYPFWKDDSLHLKEFRLAGKDTVYQQTESIDYIVGSGQHTNSHIINTNGYLHQAPATFYTQKGEWHLPPGFEDGNNSRFSRIIGLECMSCHNAYPKFVLGSENKYEKIKTGIDCERCHGPGEYHVLQKQAGIVVDTSRVIDYSIVNPAKLAIDLQFDICQRCHIQGNAILKDGKSFFDFKPGMHLSEVMNVFMPVYKGRENEHIMASHAERLKQSKCYEMTMQNVAADAKTNHLKPYKNALTCVTCHNPHISVKKTNADHFNLICQNCHSENTQVCSEKLAIRKKENDNCVKCHMAFSGATDIPHVSVHDHKIAIPYSKEKINQFKQFVGIACINNPKVDAATIGKAYISYYEKFGFENSVLDSALRYLPFNSTIEKSTNFQSLIQLYFLKKDYGKVVSLATSMPGILNSLTHKSYTNTDAWTCYRIAASYQAIDQLPEALLFYKRAAELAPYHLDILNKYAIVLSLAGKIKEAKYYYEIILKEYPKHVSALTNLGFIYLSEFKNTAVAENYYTKALALNPDYEPALMNKAGLLLYLEKATEAKKILEHVLKINPQNEQARKIINQLNQKT